MTMPTITCPVCSRRSTHPDDIRTGYCGSCHDFTGAGGTIAQRLQMPTRWASANYQTQWRMVSLAGELLNPMIQELDVAPLVPGDTLPKSTREMLMGGGSVSLRRGTLFYNGNGEPIEPTAAPLCKTLQHIDAVRESEGGLLEAHLHSSDGVPVRVSTTFMGIDMSTGGTLPLIWETLIIVGDGQSIGVLEPVRYATKAAAHAGHRRVVDAIRDLFAEPEGAPV